MGRKKVQKQTPQQELDELVEAANQEHDRRCASIFAEYPEDHHENLRNDLIKQSEKDITREFCEQYPIFAKVYGPKPPKSVQFKKVQGNIGLDIEAKKYD